MWLKIVKALGTALVKLARNPKTLEVIGQLVAVRMQERAQKAAEEKAAGGSNE
jgi:hypothetical protein